MNYITNEQKAKNNSVKDEANYKHYRQLAKQDSNCTDAKCMGTPRGSVNGNC